MAEGVPSDIRRTRTCEKCKAVIPLNKVKLYPKNQDVNILVCDNCCEELKNASKNRLVGPQGVTNRLPEPVRHQAGPKSSVVYTPECKKNIYSQKILSLPPATYIKYHCVRCNYNFKVDAVKAGIMHTLLCPYCGKSEKIERIK